MAGARRRRAATALAVVVLLVLTASFAGAAEGPRVRVIEAVDDPPRQMVALDDVLVGPASWPNDGAQTTAPSWPPRVQVSDDAQHWRRVDLPGAPAGVLMNPAGVQRVGGVAVVTATMRVEGVRPESRSPGIPVLVWTSDDGEHWRGGHVADAAPPFGQPEVVNAGRVLLVAARGDGTEILVHRSTDGGRGWREGAVRGLALEIGDAPYLEQAWPDGDDLVALLGFSYAADRPSPVQIRSRDGGRTWRQERCPATPRHCGARLAARGLELRGLHASTDGAETWERIRFRPEITDADPDIPFRPELRSLRRAGDGWLMTAGYSRNQESHHEILLRSTDGRTWRRLLPVAPCDDPYGDPSSTVSPPMRAAGGWYTAYGCTAWSDDGDDENDLDDTRVLVGDRAGVRWEALPGVPLVRIDEMLRFDGRLLVPFGGRVTPSGPATTGFLEIETARRRPGRTGTSVR